MSDVAKAREAVAEAVRSIAYDSYNQGEGEASSYEHGHPTPERATQERRAEILASPDLAAALDALILAARRDEWATRKGPALLAVVEAALERKAADEELRQAILTSLDGRDLNDALDRSYELKLRAKAALIALDRALASLTRNDEVI